MQKAMTVSNRAVGAVFAIAVVMATATPATAQNRDIRRKDAYLGINLTEQCLDVVERSVCSEPPVIQSVVVGGPADVAGVRTGDVLVSIGGVLVTTVEGREALFDLRRETPVKLSLVRAGLSVDLEVVPAPLALDRQVRFMPYSSESRGVVGESRTIRIREAGRTAMGFTVEIEAVDEEGNEQHDSMHYVVVQTDSAGNTMVKVAMPPTFVVEGSEVRNYAPVRIRGESAVEGNDDGLEYRWRYVLRDGALAERLESARQFAQVGARARIDTLLRMHGVVRGHSPDSVAAVWFQSEGSNQFVTTSPSDLARMARSALAPDVRKLFESRNRAAGAEFQALTPQLADYFPGAEAGLLVLRVIPGTPAGQLGLLQGDVVVEVGGERALEMAVLQRALAGPSRSTPVFVKWIRKGAEHEGALAHP